MSPDAKAAGAAPRTVMRILAGAPCSASLLIALILFVLFPLSAGTPLEPIGWALMLPGYILVMLTLPISQAIGMAGTIVSVFVCSGTIDLLIRRYG